MPLSSLHDNPARTTPIGMLRWSTEFLRAAGIVDEHMGSEASYEVIAPVPVMFLTGHSIELSLKAFLLKKGKTPQELRSRAFGHDLKKLIDESIRQGLADVVPLTAEDIQAVELLNELHSTKQLLYFVSGTKTVPVYGPVERVALNLAHGIGEFVGFVSRDLPHAL